MIRKMGIYTTEIKGLTDSLDFLTFPLPNAPKFAKIQLHIHDISTKFALCKKHYSATYMDSV